MDITLNEEQEMLRTIARDFLANECPRQVTGELIKEQKGYSESLWRKMAELGWPGLVFPEKYGGSGGNFLDLTVLFEELGRACCPGPFFSTAVGGLLILEAGREEQKEEFLPAVTSGKMILALAYPEPDTGDESALVFTQPGRDSSGYFVLHGTQPAVENARIADFMVCGAKKKAGGAKEECTLFLVDAKSTEISCSLFAALSGERLGKVVFDGVRVPEKNILGDLNKGGDHLKFILGKAKILKCAEMLGGAQQVLEMVVAYACERVQFGRRIGSFQAVQHMCADMAIEIDGARYLIYRAAWEMSAGRPREVNIALAKAWASEVYYRVCLKAHEIFGAIGFTEEHDLHLFTRRARAYDLVFGDARCQREIVTRDLGL